jgi:hypothetical protein
MARKAWLGLFFVFLSLSTCCVAQNNEFSVSVGATVSSGTKARTCNIFSLIGCPQNFGVDPNTAVSYEGTYAHRLGDFRVASLYIELPVLGIPSRTIHLEGSSFFDLKHSALFVTPSLKFKFLPKSWISPFVSAGGGFTYFGNSFSLSNTSAAGQIGAGVDFKTRIPFLGFRVEARDFISGRPKIEELFGVNSPAVQHNVFMGGGIVLHF